MQLPSWIPFQKKQEPPRVVRGEISLADPQLYPRGIITWPYNPDIFVQQKSMTIYDRMRRDEQVKSCQWLKRLSVLCSGWQVEAATDDGADEEIADFCTECLERLRGTLEEHIKQILTAMDYGFSVTEKIFDIIDKGDFRGKIGLKSLKTRKPHRWDFQTDEYGNLLPDGLWQENGQYKYDPAKFIIYSHQKEFDNWYGRSDLQECYRSWWAKDVIIKFWNVYLEKFGMGIPWLRAAEGKQLNDPTYTTLKNAVYNLQAASAIAYNLDDAELSILESTRRGAGEYDKAVQYYDRAISRALLMPSGLGFSDESAPGSHARSKTHFNLWIMVMMDMRKIAEETIMNEQVIRPLVDLNYTVSAYPKFKFLPIEDDERESLAKMWLEAVKGKAVHPDAEDEIHFRRLIKFPERSVEDLEAEFDEDKNTPSPPMPPALPQPQQEEPKEPITMHARAWHRKLTRFEKRVDFAAVERSLDELESETRKRLGGILKKQLDKLQKTLEKTARSLNMNKVNALSLQYGVEFQSIVRDFMRTGFELGRGDARNEIARAKNQQNFQVVKMPPKATITMLEKSSFWIKNITFEQLTKEVQAILISALETGESMAETMLKVRQAYDPYVGDEQVIRDAKQVEPYRIETLVRTNATKAYNRGKLVEYLDPQLGGFVRALQLSAILDSRTTDICRAADGKIIMSNDPSLLRLTPPLHHQCRSVLIPVTEVDGEFEPSKQSEIETVKSAMPKDFGGNVDK